MTEQKTATTSTRKQLKELYKKWPDIKTYLKSLGCDTTNAEDIFQEALVIFCRKNESQDFELNVDAFHYVKSTCKFIWYNQARKERKHVHTELTPNISEEESDWLEKEMKLSQIEKAMQRIGDKCRQLLQLYYGAKMNMTEIAKKVGLRSDNVAKAQKYRCIQKIKDELSNSSESTSNSNLSSL